MKRREANDKILLGAVALTLLFGGVALTLFPAPRISQRENRVLTELPQPTWATVASGSFTAELDSYATERFPFRDSLRAARSTLQIGSGAMETGGVILCTDGSLSRQIEVNQGALWQNLTALQKMRSLLGNKITVAVAPCRIEARAEVLPHLYDTEGLAAPWDSLRSALPDAITFPSLTSDAHWYRTDHHWTTEGAYLAYCQLGAHLGYTPFTREEFSQQAATDSFLGTTDAAASLPFTRADTITLWRYENDTEYTVKKDGKAVPFASLYDFDKLQTRDGYGVFLGGSCGVLEITGTTPRQRLLILRDSFSNAILPFLARHYEIIAVDPRYTRSDLQAMAQDCHAVLCLFGMQTLCTAAILK